MADNVVIYYVGWKGTLYEANLLTGTYWGVPSMDRLGARRRALDWAGIPWKDWPHGEPANMDEFGVELVIGNHWLVRNGVNRVLFGGGRSDGSDRLGDLWGQGGNIISKLDAVLAALNVQPPPPPAPPAPTTVTVAAGDTIDGLIKKYGGTRESWVATNKLANADSIQLGQVLTVPK